MTSKVEELNSQTFMEELEKIIKDSGADEEQQKHLRQYALLKLKTLRTETKLAFGRQSHKESLYETISNILGINVIGFWNFLTLIAIGLLVYGIKFDYYDPIKAVSDFGQQSCLIGASDVLSEIVRAPVNCEMCRNLRNVPVEYNLTKEKFIAEYAYSAKPVLIKNAVGNWKALNAFGLQFFRDLYDKHKDSYDVQNKDGQFFPYKTEFATLRQALHMSAKREKRNWYFGWSNNHPEVARTLRSYYDRPHFLPSDGESSKVDWIFMGRSAKGAPLHIDYVSRPSWQAQVRGIKTWELVPSPECSHICHSMNVTVHPGDIVNVDTNRWYHATFIHPGDISCTIGSEYD